MLIASFRRVIYPANRDRLTGAPLQRRRDVELMFLGRRHVGAVDLRSPLRLHFDHQLVAPPLRRGLGASALALDLLSVRVQVEDPLSVVDWPASDGAAAAESGLDCGAPAARPAGAASAVPNASATRPLTASAPGPAPGGNASCRAGLRVRCNPTAPRRATCRARRARF